MLICSPVSKVVQLHINQISLDRFFDQALPEISREQVREERQNVKPHALLVSRLEGPMASRLLFRLFL